MNVIEIAMGNAQETESVVEIAMPAKIALDDIAHEVAQMIANETEIGVPEGTADLVVAVLTVVEIEIETEIGVVAAEVLPLVSLPLLHLLALSPKKRSCKPRNKRKSMI